MPTPPKMHKGKEREKTLEELFWDDYKPPLPDVIKNKYFQVASAILATCVAIYSTTLAHWFGLKSFRLYSTVYLYERVSINPYVAWVWWKIIVLSNAIKLVSRFHHNHILLILCHLSTAMLEDFEQRTYQSINRCNNPSPFFDMILSLFSDHCEFVFAQNSYSNLFGKAFW